MENPLTEEDLTKAGLKAGSIAIRVLVIGFLISLLMTFFAFSTMFLGGGDSAGPESFYLISLAILSLAICGCIALVSSIAGTMMSIVGLRQNNGSREDAIRGINLNVSILMGIILAILLLLKKLT